MFCRLSLAPSVLITNRQLQAFTTDFPSSFQTENKAAFRVRQLWKIKSVVLATKPGPA